MRRVQNLSADHEASIAVSAPSPVPGRATPVAISRRAALALFTSITGTQWAGRAAAAEQRVEEDALYAVGEQFNNLNACALASASCVSTQNDDEKHFIPPWQYDGPQATAIARLVAIATGLQPASSSLELTAADVPRLSTARGGSPALQSVGQGLSQRLLGRPPAGAAAYNAQVAERHTTEDGSQYLHLILGVDSRNAAGTIDAEFLFLSDDNIVDIRAASRGQPGLGAGMLGLSLSDGLSYDQNTAKRTLESLRKALRWEQAPVITDFDVRFNQRRLLWFERLYQPFLGSSRVEEEPLYDK